MVLTGIYVLTVDNHVWATYTNRVKAWQNWELYVIDNLVERGYEADQIMEICANAAQDFLNGDFIESNENIVMGLEYVEFVE
ncbi:MAG: hypothetical protein LUD47_07455 [Clostridia bacterium]|nr:hypothetical protein [Clostridia bacterium]